uniref:Uncharacterized protein n=1 Tax=Anguilla anguilla TaxID=7936 RepID=A0A0E9T700_ANGAN
MRMALQMKCYINIIYFVLLLLIILLLLDICCWLNVIASYIKT